jgi:hypothetical protein
MKITIQMRWEEHELNVEMKKCNRRTKKLER